MTGLAWPLPGWAAVAWAQGSDGFAVRLRVDERVRGVLAPVVLRRLSVQPDGSAAAREQAARTPSGRAAPVILIIVGVIGLIQIIRMVNEMVHEHYYGGVIIDATKSPPEVTNNIKIPSDMVLVIQRDGSAKQFRSADLPSDLVAAALTAPK